jgi:hypothetical protein
MPFWLVRMENKFCITPIVIYLSQYYYNYLLKRAGFKGGNAEAKGMF